MSAHNSTQQHATAHKHITLSQNLDAGLEIATHGRITGHQTPNPDTSHILGMALLGIATDRDRLIRTGESCYVCDRAGRALRALPLRVVNPPADPRRRAANT
jgi:hypothetical protein